MKNGARGFTLLELLVVIVLLVMVISITSISIVSGQDSARMKTSARQLLSVLRSSRTRAIAEGVEAGITLGKLSGGAQNTAYENPATSFQGTENSDESYTIIPLDETITLPENLSLSLTTTATGSGVILPRSILFYPDGSSSGGRLLLNSPAGQMAIEVSWLTGEVVLNNGLASEPRLAKAAAQ